MSVAIDEQAKRRSCSEKSRYPSKVIAKVFASRASRRGPKIYPYECEHCGGWHITKVPPGEYRARQRSEP